MGLLGPADHKDRLWTPVRRRRLRADKTALRILVVDDDPDACDILTHVLAHLGYSAVCIQDSVEALRRLQREHFDLLLLDLVMPGLSGFDLLRAARSTSSRAAVVAVSSYNEFRHKAMDMGFDSFVAKPVELSKLGPLLEGLQPTA
jgi:CheY-like chemotaxis protein